MTKQIDPVFGEYLKDLRQMRHLTLRELSEKSGYCSSHIGRIENGNRRPDADFLLAIAPHLGIPQRFLLKEAGYTLDHIDNQPTKVCESTTFAQSLIQELMTDAVVEVSVNGKHSMARIVRVNFAEEG